MSALERKEVSGRLVLVGKSNKEEKYNILLYERVIEGVGGNFFIREPVGLELVGVGNGMIIRLMEKMVHIYTYIDARIIRIKDYNEVLWR